MAHDHKEIPDFDWYAAKSKRLRLSSRCPFANDEACPRYFLSLSLLGSLGATSISKEEDERLYAKWKQSPLWPSTVEQSPSVFGPDDRPKSLDHLCPEVAYDRFGYFATHLGRYSDEIDSEHAHQRLAKEGAPSNHPGWQWETCRGQHYSECPLHAPLIHYWPKLMNNTTFPSAHSMSEVRYDVFISHASEDKDVFVRGLAAELSRLGLRVWYDEATLKLGDSLRQKIDEGLANTTYAVVVLSRAFFLKQWPKAELDALFVRETEGCKVILPIWHRISKEEVMKFSPLLAGKLATFSEKGVEAIAEEIFSIAKPNTLKRSNLADRLPVEQTGP